MSGQSQIPLRGPYRYCPKTDAWSVSDPDRHRPAPEVPDVLRIAAHNVLFDEWDGQPYKPHVLHSADRYGAQVRLIGQMDLDVIALNEVTTGYLSLLEQQPWIRERYWLSDVSADGSSLKPFGNLLVSRIPFDMLMGIRLPRLKRPVICGFLPLGSGRRLAVCATHLSSRDFHAERRAMQLGILAGELDRLGQETGAGERLILGDLNFHSESENASIPPGYADVWKSLRPDSDPGYTFDSATNPMMQEMWPLGFELRRMRLDRLLLSSQGALQPHSIRIFARDPVLRTASRLERRIDLRWRLLLPWEVPRRLLSRLADGWFRSNVLRDPGFYLRCSDHFGLVTELEIRPPVSKSDGSPAEASAT